MSRLWGSAFALVFCFTSKTYAINTGNNPGNPNAGGYSGNYSGSTHTGTGVAGGSRAGGRSYGGSGNTGNNPGNANAGGYNGNYSGSTHGGTGVSGGDRSGGHSYGGSSGDHGGGNSNRGNNPGNPNASGYNGSYSGNRGSSSSNNGFNTSHNTELGGSIDRVAQRNAISAAGKAATAAGKKTNSMEWSKAYYNSLVSTYSAKHLDPHTQSLPSGPMNALSKKAGNFTAEEAAQAARIDAAYRSVKNVEVHMPYSLSTNKNIAKTALQAYGLKSSVVVEGPLSTLQSIGFSVNQYQIGVTNPTQYNSVLAGGIIGVANDAKFAARRDITIAHEAVHAGVHAVMSDASKNHRGVSKEVADQAQAAASAMTYHGAYSGKKDPAFGLNTPAAIKGDYINQEEEIAGFVLSGDKKTLASVMAMRGVKPAEANRLASKLANSKGLKDAVSAMEHYIHERGNP